VRTTVEITSYSSVR